MEKSLDAWKGHLEQITNLGDLRVNYDATQYESNAESQGWKIDRYRGPIAKEPPGPPTKDDVFDRAKTILRNYQFPDPHLVVGYFDPENPLQGRNMLLQAKFLFFTFYFGTRINQVLDEVCKNEIGHDCQVWGYSYQTLQGHFESGEMRFAIWKDLVSGDVSFHIDAYSKAEKIPNFFYRVGFRIFGRYLQKKFAHSALRRMQRLVQAPILRPRARLQPEA